MRHRRHHAHNTGSHGGAAEAKGGRRRRRWRRHGQWRHDVQRHALGSHHVDTSLPAQVTEPAGLLQPRESRSNCCPCVGACLRRKPRSLAAVAALTSSITLRTHVCEPGLGRSSVGNRESLESQEFRAGRVSPASRCQVADELAAAASPPVCMHPVDRRQRVHSHISQPSQVSLDQAVYIDERAALGSAPVCPQLAQPSVQIACTLSAQAWRGRAEARLSSQMQVQSCSSRRSPSRRTPIRMHRKKSACNRARCRAQRTRRCTENHATDVQ